MTLDLIASASCRAAQSFQSLPSSLGVKSGHDGSAVHRFGNLGE